ncbi:hypothetical protein GUJ93_ZPchr0003g17367 [Zizania palustris]|uniref:Uncharacterized protein n=1 Tax=Zizania palustris TaxID=103762 RepID=A0A8J5SCR2_ZIZPA|nr:hypothetical protein GUJ93_ZPchr0003g17367 [Zizania palustris]
MDNHNHSLANNEDCPPKDMIDWFNIEIEPVHDDEGRFIPTSDDVMYVELGLREEDEQRENKRNDDDAISIDEVEEDGYSMYDSIPEEQCIVYDKNNPQFYLDARYPTMADF